MGIDIKIHNDVIISSYIDDKIYSHFIKQLSQSLVDMDQGDYSDVFILDNSSYDGQSVLKVTNEWIRGSVEDVIRWLRLVDIFILRPHGCYLTDQHLNFNEFYNSSDPVVVTLATKDDHLMTKISRFANEVPDEQIHIDVKKVPQTLWVSLVNQLTGQNFDHYEYEVDHLFDGGVNLIYSSPSIEKFRVKYYGNNDDICYHYSPQFNLDDFINKISVKNILQLII